MTVMEGHGRNRYTCKKCGGKIITEDRDEGTTAFMIECKAKLGCKGMMESSFYRGDFVNSGEPPAYIWRKPTQAEIMNASRAMAQHFAMGGLGLYRAELPVEGNAE